MIVKLTLNDNGNPPRKLADAELHFTEGVLEGLKLVGFGIWERRSFSLLRPIEDATAQNRIREAILEASAADTEETRAAVAT